MSTKIFYYRSGIDSILLNMKYNDTKDVLDNSTGNPIEHQLNNGMYDTIQGWHNIQPNDKIKIIDDYVKAGWVEGEEI